MVEVVDTLGLGPRGNSLAGSSPAIRNQPQFPLQLSHYKCVTNGINTRLLLILSHDHVITNHAIDISTLRSCVITGALTNLLISLGLITTSSFYLQNQH